MRTELVATVSHELRTPLTAIGGHLELLGDAAYGELTDDQRMMIGAANRNVERLASLIDDLLCLSRLDEPASVSPKERVDVAAAAQRTMDAVAGMVHRREQTVQVELPSTAAEILGDRVQLDLAIVNLLSNASKYSPAGGRIRLAVSQIDRRVVIEVSDNGMGIRSNERGQLFERFFRGADAGSRGIAGTGLGLAIVKQIVDRHGGVIDVTSTWGDGSTFRIELPAAS
jgi:signal transduction histidine kinase